MSPKAVLLPVAIFTNLNSEPGLHGIAWLVAELFKFLEPTSSYCFFYFMCLYIQVTQARRRAIFF